MIQQAIQDLMQLLPIASPPGKEEGVATFLREQLLNTGIPAAHIQHDNAQDQSEYGGEVGNLIVQIDGHVAGPRLMFSTHMDTVPDAVGCKPRLDIANRRIVNDASGCALGGDNRNGCAILLILARELMRLKGAHQPVTLVFFVQEEVGLVGARGLDLEMLGTPRPAMCFNLDGGPVEEIVTAVIGTQRFTIEVTGIPAHSGRPQTGVSAGVIMGLAMASLQNDDWHGRIEKPEGSGTANLGIVKGGTGSNVVMPRMEILAEARSHDPAFRRKIIDTWQAAFDAAAQSVRNLAKEGGSVQFGTGPTYESFALSDDAPVVQTTLRAAAKIGLAARTVSNDGGMDANWIVAHGIPTVTIAPGQRQVHTVDEWIDLHDFEQALRMIVTIATGNGKA